MLRCVLLLCALPCVLGGGAPSPPIPFVVKKTLTSGQTYNCKINKQYGGCIVELKGEKGKALTVTTKAADNPTASDTSLFLTTGKDFGFEQQVKFDRVTKVGAGSRRRNNKSLLRTITLPADGVETKSYYAFVQKTSPPKPTPTPTPTPTLLPYPAAYAITYTNANMKNPVQTITLGGTTTFTNVVTDKLNSPFESYRYFKVNTSSVAAPKSLVIHLAMSTITDYPRTDTDTGYTYVEGPSIFITSKSPAELRPDDYTSMLKLGKQGFEARKWTLPGSRRRRLVVDTAMKPAMTWHQPAGTTWNTMYVVVAMAQSIISSRRKGRKLMGGADITPVTGTIFDNKINMKVVASTVTSCKIPTGTGSTMNDAGRRRRSTSPGQPDDRNKFRYTVDYAVAPALTADNNALLNARLHASNLEMPPDVLQENMFGFRGCQVSRDRTAWQKLNTPKCDTKTFYAVPQCKSACQSMTKCHSFKTLFCDDKPTTSCDSSTAANRGSSSGSSSGSGGGAVVVIVILVILVLAIGGGIASCVFCCCNQNTATTAGMQQTVVHTTQPVAIAQPGAAVPLPPGWVQAVDPSGKPYWANASTGQSQWEQPTA